MREVRWVRAPRLIAGCGDAFFYFELLFVVNIVVECVRALSFVCRRCICRC